MLKKRRSLSQEQRKKISKFLHVSLIITTALIVIMAITFLVLNSIVDLNSNPHVQQFKAAWLSINALLTAFNIPLFYAKVLLVIKNFSKHKEYEREKQKEMLIFRKQKYKKIAKKIEAKKNAQEGAKLNKKEEGYIKVQDGFKNLGIALSAENIAWILKNKDKDIYEIRTYIHRISSIKLPISEIEKIID